MFQQDTYNYWMNTIWTELYRVEPHDPVSDPVSDPVFFAEARRRMAVEPTTTGIHSGLQRFTS